MLDDLPYVSRDPIVGLMAEVSEDTNPEKIDLGAGVYRNDSGITPVFDAVRLAERQLWESNHTKTYTKQTGPDGALEAIQELILGKAYKLLSTRLAGTITAGGTGAIRTGAELILRNGITPTVWLSNPTWSNHERIFSLLGFKVRYYDFLDDHSNQLVPQRIFDALKDSQENDILLLHGCCHNPTGIDLSNEIWKELAILAQKRKLIPFIDLAYQGFGESVSKDVYNLQELLECENLIIATSCSKNFGLYRERVGSLTVLCQNNKQKMRVQENINNITRTLYSFPPAHGAFIVKEILQSESLRKLWQDELAAYVNRIKWVKERLVNEVNSLSGSLLDLSYIKNQQGMFSFLKINPKAVSELRKKHSIYMTENGRINVTGLSASNLSLFSQRLTDILLKIENRK